MSSVFGINTLRFLVACFLLLTASEASAQLKFCNKTPYELYTAVGRAANGGKQWVAEGWWKLQPGQCAWVVGGSRLKYRYYYAHAEAKGELAKWVYGKNGATWGSDTYFCVDSSSPFKLVNGSSCSGRGRRAVEFTTIDTKDADESTFSFSDSKHPTSRKGAAALRSRLLKTMHAERQRERDKRETQQNLARNQCSDMPTFHRTLPAISVPLLGTPVRLEPRMAVDFQGPGARHGHTRVKATTEVGLKELERLFRQRTSKRNLGIPGNNCNHRFHLSHSVGVSQEKMSAKVKLKYEVWACCKDCRPGGSLLNPTRENMETRLETVRSHVELKLSAAPTRDKRGVNVTSTATRRADTHGFMTGAAEALGLGNAYQNAIEREMKRLVDSTVTEVLKKLRWEQDGLVPYGLSRQAQIQRAYFKMSGGHPALVIETVGDVPQSQSCTVYRQLKEPSFYERFSR